MYTILQNSADQGLITAFMALGVMVTFQLMGFPDMTVEGSFMLGGVVTTTLLVDGINPFAATLVGIGAGMCAGITSGVMHTKLGINAIICGILTTSAAFSVALVVMGRPNAPLMRIDGVYELARRGFGLPAGGWGRAIASGALLVAVALALFWFLNTNLGITIRAVGSNERMIRSLSVDTDNTKILAMAISNGLVALSGALATQAQGFADVNMGTGALVAAFASVVVGQTLVRSRRLAVSIAAVIIGAVLYRMLLNFAVRSGLRTDYFKLLTALMVLIALAAPAIAASLRERRYLASLRRRDAARRAVAAELAAQGADAS